MRGRGISLLACPSVLTLSRRIVSGAQQRHVTVIHEPWAWLTQTRNRTLCDIWAPFRARPIGMSWSSCCDVTTSTISMALLWRCRDQSTTMRP
jgi:hypothetical protein